MSSAVSYARNDELFRHFYSLQGCLAAHLAGHPGLIRAWLEAQPQRLGETGEAVGASKAWRTARLSGARRQELFGLIRQVERSPAQIRQLALWLLESVPVRIYLEMADLARPSLQVIDPAADECRRELVGLRETLFLTNYGLARVASLNRRHPDHGDRLSAASCGLLDAIDRYVPGRRAARFGYFASYWIRYHLSRHAQKNGSLVAYPINQHRISRRIDRCLAERQSAGQPPASEAEICAELRVGLDALYWHQRRPRVMSLHSPAGFESESQTMEHVLCDSAPEPGAALDERETASHLRGLLRVHAAPAARVMLAYARGVGALPEAAEDYLAHLHRVTRDRIRHQVARTFAMRTFPAAAQRAKAEPPPSKSSTAIPTTAAPQD